MKKCRVLKGTPEVSPVTLTIPTELQIISKPIGGIEGLSLTPLPILVVYDNSGNIVNNLGIGESWMVSISLMTDSTSSVQVLPSSETTFIEGYANLTNFSISHPGNGYVLKFNITDPPVGFTAQTDPFDVAVRELVINIVELPDNGNTTLPLYPYPTVELLDKGILQRVANLGWRGRRWYARLQILGDNRETMVLNAEFNSDNASVIFKNLLITQPGRYVLEFSAFTIPQSEIIVMGATESITIISLPSAMMRFVLDANFSSVIGNDQESFIQSITSQLSDLLQQVTIFNVSLTEGSIIVTFNAQSEKRQDVQNAINIFLDMNFTITYNGVTYSTINKTADFTSTENTEDDDDDSTIIIIACCIGGFLLIVLLILLVVTCWWCSRKRYTKVWKLTDSSSHNKAKPYEIHETYFQASQSYVEENEYVAGPGVVRDLNMNDSENDENSNEKKI